MKVFVTRQIMPHALDKLKNEGLDVEVWTGKENLSPAELAEKAKDAHGLLVAGLHQIDKELIESCPELKVIALHSVGYDHVDLEAAKQAGIRVSHTPGVLNRATADMAFLLMLSVSRKAFHHYSNVKAGNWGAAIASDDLGMELYGKTLGIFGLGNIGYEMAKRSKDAFGMKIIYHNRSRNEEAEAELGADYVSFDELLSQSDVISVHANLSEETDGVFDAGAFGKMKKSAIFVNTARGGLHNEKDLAAALRSGEIWGAGLDVTNPEPMEAGNPLLEMPNVCVTPHIGSATVETRTAMIDLAVENLILGLKGEELKSEVKTDE